MSSGLILSEVEGLFGNELHVSIYNVIPCSAQFIEAVIHVHLIGVMLLNRNGTAVFQSLLVIGRRNVEAIDRRSQALKMKPFFLWLQP